MTESSYAPSLELASILFRYRAMRLIPCNLCQHWMTMPQFGALVILIDYGNNQPEAEVVTFP